MTKTVLLTGASAGIGRAAAYRFVEAGYNVALVARSANKLAPLAAELGPQALALPADISQRSTNTTIVQQTLAHFGQLNILVNNAGIGIYGPTATASPEDMQRVMAVNFWGPIYLMQASIPAMKANGGGLIINVASIIGRRSTPWSGVYCASKAALEHIVESLRVELAADNIRFSTLYPGVTHTDFMQHSLGNARQLRGRVTGVPAAKVAAKLVQVAKKEPRDAYVTLLDAVFVNFSRLFPALMDWVFQRYFNP